MNFIDSATVTVTSGNGGDGSASFHREKHVPRGGPNGANGGKGGDVVLVARRGMRTLYDLSLRQVYVAKDGSQAQGNKGGKNGADLIIDVPIGTLVADAETGNAIGDLVVDGQKVVVAKGGRGGLGNEHFTSSVRQAPTFAEKGAPGESRLIQLELKLVADVGLVGLPNAGKSTLVSVCSAAKPKIGSYPFTTITPNLGVVSIGGETFTMADMPGLIEGASEGRGLGHQFLKHVDRTSLLVHVVDCAPMDMTDPVANFETVEAELAAYSDELGSRPRLLVINKIDLIDQETQDKLVASFKSMGLEPHVVSGATQEGLEPLLFAILGMLREAESAKPAQVIVRPAMTESQEKPNWEIEETEFGFKVSGQPVERWVSMTNLGNREALQMLHKRLVRIGVIDKLKQGGAEHGDTVRIGDWEFEYKDWS